ncbi:MAG: hypothetical protein PHQ23_10630, partial [Candidatus Wallbacteria bacterium]|nr:hypothetical protein [Candidatus Wallbacteria bacterium]
LILEKGIEALEEMLVARDHMYSSVYTHKTSRIAEMMLLRAAQSSLDNIPGFESMVDAQLFAGLEKADHFSGEIFSRLLTRNLYKRAYTILCSDKASLEKFADISGKFTENSLEETLTKASGLSKGQVIADMPIAALSISEPRLKQINIRVLRKSHEEILLPEVSPLTKALLHKESSHMLLGIYCPPEHRVRVRKASQEILT